MSEHDHRPENVILVTGANGFLGRNFCRYLEQKGYRVRALVRSPDQSRELEKIVSGGLFRYSMPLQIEEIALHGNVAGVIHCAFSTSGDCSADSFEASVIGSQRLIEQFHRHGLGPVVFISSMAAHSDAESYYGRAKYRVEKLLNPDSDLVIRPGLIVGDGGLFARMRESIRRLPLVPLFYGAKQQIQIISVLDLCRIVEVFFNVGVRGTHAIAASPPYPVKEFYRSIASLENRHCRFVRLPGELSYHALRLAEKFHAKLPVNSQNLLGLKQMRLMEPSRAMSEHGLVPEASLSKMVS